jgi:PilZ domain
MVTERRSEPRDERVAAVVWIRDGGVMTPTVVRNASRHGLCIDHVRYRDPGQTFEVQVIDHDHNIAFECEAVVQWSQPSPSPRTGVKLVACGGAWQRWVAARWGSA